MPEKQNILTFLDVARILAERYNLPVEIVESILVDWTYIQYKTMTEKVEFPDFNPGIDF
jgi:hypothetical protein